MLLPQHAVSILTLHILLLLLLLLRRAQVAPCASCALLAIFLGQLPGGVGQAAHATGPPASINPAAHTGRGESGHTHRTW